MKNVQVIDSAENCAYSVYSLDDAIFAELFPNDQQDIEFVEDFVQRVGDARATLLLEKVWSNRIRKDKVAGIHGTLFYGLSHKRRFYPTKRESDLDAKRRT